MKLFSSVALRLKYSLNRNAKLYPGLVFPLFGSLDLLSRLPYFGFRFMDAFSFSKAFSAYYFTWYSYFPSLFLLGITFLFLTFPPHVLSFLVRYHEYTWKMVRIFHIYYFHFILCMIYYKLFWSLFCCFKSCGI